MKKIQNKKLLIVLMPFALLFFTNSVKAQEDSAAAEEVVKLKYVNDNNSMQYLLLENYLKKGKKTSPLPNHVFQLYLDSNKAENFIAKVTTDADGRAKSFLPPALKQLWEAAPQHKFIALTPGKESGATAELDITKAKIEIDTSSGGETRSITVHVMKYENGEWVPANEVELKAGVQRLGGILSAGDDETYTTDSSGTVTIEFNKNKLPGDENGNILLAAKVDNNDLYGTLATNKTVKWGVAVKKDKQFFQHRSLWATRFRTPLWLLFMAYSIVISVWGTIIYLITRIIKIKKLGTSATS